jgi:hypothetical protein
MPEGAHQVVGYHDEPERCLGGPEVLQAERFESKVLLQLPDAVLAIGPAVVNFPNLMERQVQTGHIQAEGIVGQVFEEQFASGQRTVADLLAAHDVAVRPGPGISRLVAPLLDRDARADFHSVLHAVDLVLEVGVGPGCDDVVEATVLQRAQDLIGVEAAVATHQPHLHTPDRHIKSIAHELHAVGARRRVARAHPRIDQHARLAHEGHERMMRVVPTAVGVITLGRSFLAALAAGWVCKICRPGAVSRR